MAYPPPYDPQQPPQQPAYPTTATLDQVMPAGPPPAKSRKPLVILGAVGIACILVVGGIVFAALDFFGDSPLAEAQAKCDKDVSGTSVTDGGKTLLIDTKGEEDTAGTDISVVACVLTELKTPAAVIAHMDSTRALDGRQEDSWEGFTASWTYHPDAGMDLIVRTA